MAAEIAHDVPVSLAEAKAYLRVEGPEEDALIVGLVRTAAELCEAFTGQLLLRRAVTETIAADGEWHRLTGFPVIWVDGVDALAADGSTETLDDDESWAASFGIGGTGMVGVLAGLRLASGAAAERAIVRYRAGLAEDWNGVPEPLRQGMLRLVAHLHAHRDAADDAGPPAAVAALWRPWRRMRLR